ncbi:MAG: DUF5018 domain-containing protein [Fermentimonas sp.]|jgi:hypothetical protein
MKTKIISFLLVPAIFLLCYSCQSPEEIVEQAGEDRIGLISVVASFPYENNTENNFPGKVDHENRVITITFPYNYPRLSDNVLPLEVLQKVKIVANVSNNVTVSPPMGYFDLTKECSITVTDDITNVSKEYKIVAEIHKNDECSIQSFAIPSQGLTGIVNEADHTISLITLESIGTELAEIELSHGASCYPDPRTEALDFDKEQTIKVTAQNGSDFLVYKIIKDIPKKLSFGIRENSGKLKWAKKLSDIGISTKDRANSLAVLSDYVVINERGNNSLLYLNNMTGEPVGKMSLGNIVKGEYTNNSMTSDASGNILICNYTPSDSKTFTVWRKKGMDGVLEKYIEYNIVGNENLGWALSITGSLDDDAIITTPIFRKDGKSQFARWQVKGGVLQSQTPDFVILDIINPSAWTISVDVVYTSASDVNSDFYVGSYARTTDDNLRYFLRFKGADNSIVSRNLLPNSVNSSMNGIDYIEFNNSAFVAYGIVNPFAYNVNGSDVVRIHDQSSTSFAKFVELGEHGIYGGVANDGQNKGRTCDVVFRASDNGYYLYVYFMFTNGYVVCYQYDCIDF